jgi:hypothetical protein
MDEKSARPSPPSILRPSLARTHHSLAHALRSRRSRNQENHRLQDTKTLLLHHRLTRSHKLPILVRTRTFSAINSHPSTRSQVGSSNSSSSNIGSHSLYKACRTRTWQTCSRQIRSTTWILQRISSGSNNTACHPPKTRSSSNTSNNSSQHVSSTQLRASTVPWATRTRTGTGSFLEKKVWFDFLFASHGWPDRPCIHASVASLSLRALVCFFLAFVFRCPAFAAYDTS